MVPLVVSAALAARCRWLDVVFGDVFRRRTGKLRDPALASAKQPVLTDSPESLRHQMAGETVDEGRAGKGHLAGLVAFTVVFPLETDGFVLLVDAGDALIANRDPAGVAGQITHDRPGVSQGRTAENIPSLPGQAQPPVAPGFKASDGLRPRDLGHRFERLDVAQHDAPKDL